MTIAKSEVTKANTAKVTPKVRKAKGTPKAKGPTLADKSKASAALLTRLAGKRKLAKPKAMGADQVAHDAALACSMIDTWLGRQVGKALGADRESLTPKLLALGLTNANAAKLVLAQIKVADASWRKVWGMRDGIGPDAIQRHEDRVQRATDDVQADRLGQTGKALGRLIASGHTSIRIPRLGSEAPEVKPVQSVCIRMVGADFSGSAIGRRGEAIAD